MSLPTCNWKIQTSFILILLMCRSFKSAFVYLFGTIFVILFFFFFLFLHNKNVWKRICFSFTAKLLNISFVLGDCCLDDLLLGFRSLPHIPAYKLYRYIFRIGVLQRLGKCDVATSGNELRKKAKTMLAVNQTFRTSPRYERQLFTIPLAAFTDWKWISHLKYSDLVLETCN